MNSTPSYFLFIILALLQFVAPLVHAHTGEELPVQGVHLPGYEHYSVNHDSAEFSALSHSCAEAYSIISVGTGIKHKITSSKDNSQSCLLTINLILEDAARYIPPLLPQPRQSTKLAVHYLLLPSRAPPF